jgi:transposase, IS5 family
MVRSRSPRGKKHAAQHGSLNVMSRRHGLDRCLYRGQEGVKRWVGWGVIADNLIHIGGWIAAKEN